MANPIADDFAFIRARMKEIKPEPVPEIPAPAKVEEAEANPPWWVTQRLTEDEDAYWNSFYGTATD